MVAKKETKDKPRYDLLPPEALESITLALMFGAKKYSDHNWLQGVKWSKYFSACMRHMWAWWRGEEVDKESGLPHLAHAGCCVLFLLTYQLRKMKKFDDRVK